jgi:hypothetical protein
VPPLTVGSSSIGSGFWLSRPSVSATFTGLHFRLPIYNKRKGSVDFMEDIRFFREKALKKLLLRFEE